jgi:hypothetical protein
MEVDQREEFYMLENFVLNSLTNFEPVKSCRSQEVSSSNWPSLSTGFCMAMHRAISDHSHGCLTYWVNYPQDRRHHTVLLSRQYAV